MNEKLIAFRASADQQAQIRALSVKMGHLSASDVLRAGVDNLAREYLGAGPSEMVILKTEVFNQILANHRAEIEDLRGQLAIERAIPPGCPPETRARIIRGLKHANECQKVARQYGEHAGLCHHDRKRAVDRLEDREGAE